MSKIPQSIEAKLNQRKDKNSFRTLPELTAGIDFLSNDYLGFARNAELYKAIDNQSKQIADTRYINGATGSRLLSGNIPYIKQVEEKLNHFFDAEASLLFNSGYNANLSLLSSVPQKGDTIICDELSHASLIDGARLSHAKRFSFKHNDLNDLTNKLKKSGGAKYVVVESVYSMDGDAAPLESIIQVCKHHDAYLIVDEAHALGVLGNEGKGLLMDNSLYKDVFARVYTFGKAMGIHGACICGSVALIDYLVNFARPFIYSTAMPLKNYVAVEKSFDFLEHHHELKDKLKTNIQFFKSQWKIHIGQSSEALLPSDSAIQIILTPSNDLAKKAANIIREYDIEAKAILSPTVAEGKERIRLCLHAFNTESEISLLIEAIKKVFCSNTI